MAQLRESLVPSSTSWPNGRGLKGGSSWWEYVLNKDEKQRLDNLMGTALIDEGVCGKLLAGDEKLLQSFGISPETGRWLRGVQASNLTELAQAVITKL